MLYLSVILQFNFIPFGIHYYQYDNFLLRVKKNAEQSDKSKEHVKTQFRIVIVDYFCSNNWDFFYLVLDLCFGKIIRTIFLTH